MSPSPLGMGYGEAAPPQEIFQILSWNSVIWCTSEWYFDIHFYHCDSHLLSPFLVHQPSRWKSQIAHSYICYVISGINLQIQSVSLASHVSIHLFSHLSTHSYHYHHSASISSSLFYSRLKTNPSHLNRLVTHWTAFTDHGTGLDLSCSLVYF